jgi:alcohol dehydrogenase class IV
VGAVHALAYPLGAFYDVPHGIANALMLPYVLEYNYPGDIEKFARMARVMGEGRPGLSERETAALAVKAVRDLARDVGTPSTLEDLGISEDAVGDMTDAAMKITRPILNNPRPMTVEVAQSIYRRAFQRL